MQVAGKIFGNICLKGSRDAFFFHYVVCDQGGTGGPNFLMGSYPIEGESSNFWACRETPSQFRPLVGYHDLPIRKTLGTMLSLLTAEMILKRVNESIFLQTNKFIVHKVKDEKEVANSLLH